MPIYFFPNVSPVIQKNSRCSDIGIQFFVFNNDLRWHTNVLSKKKTFFAKFDHILAKLKFLTDDFLIQNLSNFINFIHGKIELVTKP